MPWLLTELNLLRVAALDRGYKEEKHPPGNALPASFSFLPCGFSISAETPAVE